MGKKRIIKKEGEIAREDQELKTGVSGKIPRKKITHGVLYIQSTFNNTIMTLTDDEGNTFLWLSSGSLGFKGAKKGTPFAATKVAETLIEKARVAGLITVDVIIKGVGAGRESALRALAAKGIEIDSISDMTPIPHNGPKPPKPRRV
jgi:small subunit ribosomal protein S11